MFADLVTGAKLKRFASLLCMQLAFSRAVLHILVSLIAQRCGQLAAKRRTDLESSLRRAESETMDELVKPNARLTAS